MSEFFLKIKTFFKTPEYRLLVGITAIESATFHTKLGLSSQS